jgi:hypothetical protein
MLEHLAELVAFGGDWCMTCKDKSVFGRVAPRSRDLDPADFDGLSLGQNLLIRQGREPLLDQAD